jgi:transketolase
VNFFFNNFGLLTQYLWDLIWPNSPNTTTNKEKTMSLTPLKTKTKLQDSPTSAPKYAVTVKDAKGQEIKCGDPSATRALVALMDLGAVNGGAASHWGGPAAAAEITSAIHALMFQTPKWYQSYNFVNDIGHAENGVYALRANLGYGDLDFTALKGFRSIESKLTGHGESHLYPEGVLLSNGPLSSAVPQAQGLAIADKLIGNDRVTIVTMSDGASMEGEAKEAFAAIPGFHKQGKINPFILVVSDNNTKLSGRISEDSFDMTPTFSSMESLGWNIIKVDNGNDLQACYTAIENAVESAKNNGPVCIWLKTVKGYGVKATEEAKSGGHGFPVKAYSDDIIGFVDEIWGGKTPEEFTTWAKELTVKPEANASSSSIKKEKAQAGFSRAAIKAVQANKPVFSVSSDLQGSTGMAAFQKEYPTHALDVGIAESNMVSTAAGLSKAGFIPVVDTFAAFGVTKGNLPHIMASLSSCPMIAVYSHTGFQDAADGASHQSTTYMSAVSSIPYAKAVVVSTSAEAESLMTQAIEEIESARIEGRDGESYFFFVGRENFPAELKEGMEYKLGRAQVIREGKDGVLVGCGPTLFKALKAADELASQGVEVTVINNSSVNTPDVETIGNALKNANNKLITVEDHQVIGGMGSMLIHALKDNGFEFKSKSLGIKGHFGQSAYTADQLYSKNGLDEVAIIGAFNGL